MLDDGSTREYITNGTIDRYIERWNGKVKVNIFVQQKKMGSPLYNNHFNEIIPLLIERFMNRACIRMGFFLDPKYRDKNLKFGIFPLDWLLQQSAIFAIDI